MQLCSVEHKLNTSSTFLSSKLDSPSPMFWLEENLTLSNVLITGESNFDEKNVEKVQLVFNWTELHTYWNYLLQNWYFRWENYSRKGNYSREETIWGITVIWSPRWRTKFDIQVKKKVASHSGGWNLWLFSIF